VNALSLFFFSSLVPLLQLRFFQNHPKNFTLVCTHIYKTLLLIPFSFPCSSALDPLHFHHHSKSLAYLCQTSAEMGIRAVSPRCSSAQDFQGIRQVTRLSVRNLSSDVWTWGQIQSHSLHRPIEQTRPRDSSLTGESRVWNKFRLELITRNVQRNKQAESPKLEQERRWTLLSGCALEISMKTKWSFHARRVWVP